MRIGCISSPEPSRRGITGLAGRAGNARAGPRRAALFAASTDSSRNMIEAIANSKLRLIECEPRASRYPLRPRKGQLGFAEIMEAGMFPAKDGSNYCMERHMRRLPPVSGLVSLLHSAVRALLTFLGRFLGRAGQEISARRPLYAWARTEMAREALSRSRVCGAHVKPHCDPG